MPISQMRMLRSKEITQLVSVGRARAGVGGEEKSSGPSLLQPDAFTLPLCSFFGLASWQVGPRFPDRGLNLQPLHWELRVLTF